MWCSGGSTRVIWRRPRCLVCRSALVFYLMLVWNPFWRRLKWPIAILMFCFREGWPNRLSETIGLQPIQMCRLLSPT